MNKWADYLISEVGYDKNHLIVKAKRHEEQENGITKGELVDRVKITSDISKGFSYITIYDRISTWKKGSNIKSFKIRGEPFLRIDKNKVNQDYLGDIPQFFIQAKSKSIPPQESKSSSKQIAELEHTLPQEPPKNPRGSLPMETTEELPQELELAPEPVIESPEEPEEATPEQIARLEELEKQIAELESQPEEPEEATPEQIARLEELEKQIAELEHPLPQEPPKNPRGSLPMETTEELPQELELAPEPVIESTEEPEEATPEQIARLEELEKQIAELESQPEEPEEATPEQIARLEELEKQIAELEEKI